MTVRRIGPSPSELEARKLSEEARQAIARRIGQVQRSAASLAEEQRLARADEREAAEELRRAQIETGHVCPDHCHDCPIMRRAAVEARGVCEPREAIMPGCMGGAVGTNCTCDARGAPPDLGSRVAALEDAIARLQKTAAPPCSEGQRPDGRSAPGGSTKPTRRRR